MVVTQNHHLPKFVPVVVNKLIVDVDNFNISLAPREREFYLTNKQQKCAIAMLC